MLRSLLISLSCLFLAACADSPEKYRDIKHLEMPPTLAIEHNPNAPVEVDNPLKTSAKNTESDLGRLIQIVGGDDKPTLQIKARFDRAWELVDTALTKAEVEVIDKNRNTGVFIVSYLAKDSANGSRNNSVFSFITNRFKDTDYNVTIDKDQRTTTVRVDKVGADSQAAADNKDDDSASLVKLLHKTIIADLEK